MATTRKKTTRKRSPKASVYIKPEADERVSCTVCGAGMQESQADPMGLCPKCHKKEGMQYEGPEAAQDPDTAPTSAPEGAPKRKRARKAKVEEAATTAPSDATVATTSDATKANGGNVSEVNSDDATERAPAPRPKRTARKAKAKSAANTGADSANVGPKGDATMNQLAELYQRHLQDAGKSLGTQFSYAQDFMTAVRHFGEKTKVASLTPKKVQAYFESDAVTKTKSGRGKAQPTIAKTRRVLRLALVWAAETGLIATAPLPPKAD